ncbi:MAG: NifU family protein [Ferrimicrobium sp.]
MSDTYENRADELATLIAQLRPAVQADGGDLLLGEVDYKAGIITVSLTGACASCAISTTTIKAGVERILKARLPWVSEVRGELDDTIDLDESARLGRGRYVATPIQIRG